ncbi:hypothetical protein HYY69_07745 [Candidatus Woesearchaeota archaeon]|nr:hypothetical protein [Candidatus Woesearchaeota archaeon]
MFEKLKEKWKIWFALRKAKQEEHKHIVTEQELEDEEKEFETEDKQLTKILEYSNDYYKNLNEKKSKKRKR